MLFPSKHLKLSQSIWAVGGIVLGILTKPKDTETVWREFCDINDGPELPYKHSFDNFLLALNFLFSIDTIDIDDTGALYKK